MGEFLDERSRQVLRRLTDHASELPAIVHRLAKEQGIEPRRCGDWTRFAFLNGGGDSAIWFFGGPANEMLLLTFDHESRLNLYDRDAEAQLCLYDGLPGRMRDLVTGQDDDDAWLTMPAGDTRVVASSGAFSPDLSQGPEWEATPGLIQLLAAYGARMRETGLVWLMKFVGL